MTVFKEIASDIYQWSEYSEEKQLSFNGYYLVHHGESVIIDPPVLSDDGLRDLKNLIEKNLDSPLKAVLLTNVHHDRVSQKIKKIFSIPLYIHKSDASELDFKADYTFENFDNLFCGLRVIHLENQKSPGESAFYLADQKIMFVGDALIGKVPGKLNLLPPEKFADINEARKSLQVLKNYDFDNLLLGDGESILGKGKAALEEFLGQSH